MLEMIPPMNGLWTYWYSKEVCNDFKETLFSGPGGNKKMKKRAQVSEQEKEKTHRHRHQLCRRT